MSTLDNIMLCLLAGFVGSLVGYYGVMGFYLLKEKLVAHLLRDHQEAIAAYQAMTDIAKKVQQGKEALQRVNQPERRPGPR